MPETASGRALLERASRLRPVWPFGAEDRLSSDTIARKVEEIEREARARGRAEALSAEDRKTAIDALRVAASYPPEMEVNRERWLDLAARLEEPHA